MTLSKPSVPALAVLVMMLTPLMLVTPGAFLVAAPVAVGAALVFGLPRRTSHVGAKAKGEEGVEVMCLEGLDEHPEVKADIAAELEKLWRDTPAEKDPVACACVKREGEAWLGILRMRTTDGHSYAQMTGGTPQEVGTKVVETVRQYQVKFPVLQPEAVPYAECNEGCCPLGRRSVFYIDRDIHGRRGRRVSPIEG